MNIPGKNPVKACVHHVCIVLVVKIALKCGYICTFVFIFFLFLLTSLIYGLLSIYLFIVDPCSLKARVVDIRFAQSVDPHESSHLNRHVLSCL